VIPLDQEDGAEGFQGFQGYLRAWVLLVDSRAEVLIPEKWI